MDVDKVEFRVVLYKEEIEAGYSLTTFSQAHKNIASVREAYRSSQIEKKEVRLKNGFLSHEDHEGESDSKISCKLGYQEETKYKLVSNLKLGGDQLTKDDCLIALAYAAEHDDAKEVKELVQFAGQEILHTRMPFFYLGTILHVCTTWASLATLKLIKETVQDPEPDLAYMVDRDGDTALHNLPNYLKSYAKCKEAASLVLDLAGNDARKLLAVQGNYGDFTALCKALVYGKTKVCKALLDAAQKKEEDATTSESASESSHWLTLKARRCPYYGVNEDNLYHNDDKVSFTAMHLAVSRKYGEIVIKMLEYPGATGLNLTSLRDHNDNTPLHVAAMIGDPGICMTLLKYDEKLMNKDAKSGVRSENIKADESALHTASTTQGHAESGVRSKNKVGETALHIASTEGHAEVCERLLEYGASLSERDTHGRYALTNAFAKGHNKVVKKLLDACLPSRTENSGPNNINAKAKANPHINEHFEMGLTPLHVAVAVPSSHHIQHLIKAGALVNSTSEDGRTPLHVAAARTSDGFYLVRYLLELVKENLKSGKKEWINMKDICGQTALHYIIRLSSHSTKDLGGSRSLAEEKIPDQLESNSGITTDEESDGDSAQAACCEMEQACCKTVRSLLKEGAWVDLQDCDGETSLHVAARSKHEKVVETLLSKATKKNFRRGIEEYKDKWICRCDFSGETALHEAAREGDLQSVRHLLKFTKRPNDLLPITDMRNRTAFHWAARSSNPKEIMDEMMKCEGIKDITKQVLLWNLRESNIPLGLHADHYKVEVDQTKLLETAVETKNVDIARDLINKGADVTALGYDDQHWLAKNLGKTTSDRPTSDDTLGRKELVQGVATLLLNPYTETPITIGIFGSWGVGKSSFMLQVEEAMLYMVVKETFKKAPDSLSHVKKSSIIKFSRRGLTLRYMVVKALKQRMMIKADKYNQSSPLIQAILATFMKALRKTIPIKDIESQTPSKIEDDIITTFPMELLLNYRQMFKSLALTDKSKLLLRAISVILGSCGINVVIGVDKDMVQRAITREFLKDTTDNVFDMWVDKKKYPKVRCLEVMANVERETTQEKRDSQNAKSGSKIGNDDKYLYTSELAQNYLQKIIQLPIQMPDPSRKHIEGFLQQQVGQYIARLKEDKEPNNKEYKQKKSKKETGKTNVKEKQTNIVEHTQSEESIKENIEGEQVKDEEYLQGQERQMHDASKPVEFQLLSENYSPLLEKETGKRNVKEKKINFAEHVQSEESIEEIVEREEQVKDEEHLQGQERQMHDASNPVEFRLLLANYTPMEKDMLKRLCQSTTKERRIPREWKRFFNYHRLAWTILSQDSDMESREFKGWQRKLILWIFICWNWRAEMDVIFEKWHDILTKSSKWQAQKHLLQGKDNSDGISLELCDIICAYLESMGWSTKEELNQNEVEQGYKVVPKAWIDLKNILKEEYDISMHFIEKFQQFRFYCILNHLEIGEQFKPKKVSLISIKSSLDLNHKI